MKWTFEPCKENYLLSVWLSGEPKPGSVVQLKDEVVEQLANERYNGLVLCCRRVNTDSTFTSELRELAKEFEQLVTAIQPRPVGIFAGNNAQYGMARQVSYFVSEECPEFGIFRDATEIESFFAPAGTPSAGLDMSDESMSVPIPPELGLDCCTA